MDPGDGTAGTTAEGMGRVPVEYSLLHWQHGRNSRIVVKTSKDGRCERKTLMFLWYRLPTSSYHHVH